MSAPEASSTRQRTYKVEKDTENENVSDSLKQDDKTPNPASLSGNPNKKVARNKPYVKPPFIDMSMNKFLSYLVLSLFAILAFYIWRFTVYAHEVGGYWAVMTGRHKNAASVAAEAAAKAAESAQTASSAQASAAEKAQKGGAAGSGAVGKGSAVGGIKPKPAQPATTPEEDVQTQILHLANALGIKPAELSAAIRPLIDPSVPNPVDKAKAEMEALKAQVEAEAKKAEAQKEEGGGSVLGVLGEALLD